MEDNILLWQEENVHSFFCSLGFTKYEDQIREHGISGEILVHLDHEALKDVGIHSVGHRLAILKAVYQLKLQHDVPIEEGHWVPPSEFMDQVMVDSPLGVIPPERMYEMLRERDERIRSLEVSIQRLQDNMVGVRDEVHVISKTLYTKEPPTVSINKLRPSQSSPTNTLFPHQPLSHSSSLHMTGGPSSRHQQHARSGSLPYRDHNLEVVGISGSPGASPIGSPTRRQYDGAYSSITATSQHDASSNTHAPPTNVTSLRRQRSTNGLLSAHSATSAGSSNNITTSGSVDGSTSPLPTAVTIHASNSTDPVTPTASSYLAQSQNSVAHQYGPAGMSADPVTPSTESLQLPHQSPNTAIASTILSDGLRPTTSSNANASSSRPSTSQDGSHGGGESGTIPSSSTTSNSKEGSSLTSRGGSSSASSGWTDNPYKSFRVTLDDPCYRVLPAALKKYKINDDWRQYALFICYGSQERCLSYDEKPLLLFQKLKDTNQNPVFMLRHIKDIKSPIAVAGAKHAARREKRLKEGKTITGEGKEGPIREFTRATRLHHPAVLQPVNNRSPNSPNTATSNAAAGDKEKEGDASADGKENTSSSPAPPGNGYALAIYPYMADREDEFDVAVGDTFVILNKTKGWWVVHRDTKATDDSDIVRSGWVPQGCLLETSVPPSSFSSSSPSSDDKSSSHSALVSSSTPINPSSIVSVSTPGIALMDYTPRGSDEINLKKDDKLRVFKRYNHWSYVIKEGSGERGWTPSWFVGKVSSGSGSTTSTPTTAPLTSMPSASGGYTGTGTSGVAGSIQSSSSSGHPAGSNAATTLTSAGSGNGETTPTSASMHSGAADSLATLS